MAVSSEFYLARAAECGRDAQLATLENVRVRSLRSEAAWKAIADKASSRQEERETLAAEKAIHMGKAADG